MKYSVLYSICLLLFCASGLMNAQELKFAENNFYSYMKGDTLVEELLLCKSEELLYTIGAEGGTPEYTFEWTYSPSCSNKTNESFAFKFTTDTVETVFCKLSDQTNNFIVKQINIYPKIYLDSLPKYVKMADTSIYLQQRPHNATVKADGIYFDELKEQYFLRPDSAGTGNHTVTLKCPYTVKCPDGNDSLSSEGGPSFYVYEDLRLEFQQLATFSMNAFCADWVPFDMYDRYDVTGGVPPYNVEFSGNYDVFPGEWHLEYVVTDLIGNETSGWVDVIIDEMHARLLTELPEYVIAGSAPLEVEFDVMSFMGFQSEARLFYENNQVDGQGKTDHQGLLIYTFNPDDYSQPGQYRIDFEFYDFSGCDEHYDLYFEVVDPLEIDFASFSAESLNLFCNTEQIDKSYTVIGGKEPYEVQIDWEAISQSGQTLLPYTVTDASGQLVSGELQIEIIEPVSIRFAEDYPQTVIEDDAPFTVVVESVSNVPITGLKVTTSWGLSKTIEPLEPELSIPVIEVDPDELVPGMTYWIEVETMDDCGLGEKLHYEFSIEPADRLFLTWTASTDFCEGDVFAGLEATGGTEPYTYSWTVNDVAVDVTESSFEVSPELYEIGEIKIHCTVTDATGRTYGYNLQDYVRALPEILLDDATVQLGEEHEFMPTIVDPYGKYTYQWNTGESTESIVVRDRGTYEVTVKSQWGCINSAQAELDVVVPELVLHFDVDVDGPNRICENSQDEIFVNIKPEGGAPFDDGSYEMSVNGQIVTRTDMYRARVTADNPVIVCKVTDSYGNEITENYEIQLVPAPEVSLEDATITEGETHEFVPSGNASAYLWSTGETSPSIVVSEAGLYTVEAVNEFGCGSSVSANLFVESCEYAVTIKHVWNNYRTVTFSADVEAVAYEWTVNGNVVGTDKTYTADVIGKSITITLRVANEQGCAASDTKTVLVELPDLFSIEGTVMNCCSFETCGQTVAYLISGDEFIAVDTADVQEDGTYIHENLPKGRYTIKAIPCDPDAYKPSYYVHATTPEDAASINLIGDAFSVDIVLVPYCTLSVEDADAVSMKIYPNPMFEKAFIEIGNVQNAEIQVIDQLGKIVLHKTVQNNQATITNTELKSGLYTVIVLSDGTTLASEQLMIK